MAHEIQPYIPRRIRPLGVHDLDGWRVKLHGLYATGDPTPAIPFWPLVFKNVRLFFLGGDDFPAEAKTAAAGALNETLAGGWPGFG